MKEKLKIMSAEEEKAEQSKTHFKTASNTGTKIASLQNLDT